MDSLLLIIKYIFGSKNIDNKDDSIDEFFDNGLSFPKFISTVLDVDEIPKINKDPKNKIDKMENNDIALQFLFQKSQAIAKLKIEFKNKDDKANLLLQILTKQYFKIDIENIIEKCNLIVEPLNIKFEKKSDILTINCLLSLMNILTDGKVQIKKDINSMNDFDQNIAQIFEQFHAPLIINQNSLNYENQDIFLIQIEILFDFFSDKIHKIENQSKQKVTNRQIKQEEEEEEEEGEEEDIIKSQVDRRQYINTQNNEWDNIDQKPFKKLKKKKFVHSDDSLSDNDENIKIEESIEEALLKTINLIGNGHFHFNNFHESVMNDSIPKFVMFFFNIKTIKNVQIKTTQQTSQKITKEELNNIKYVIKFLSTKEIKFEILKFNFEDKFTEESSAVLFYSNFLNLFYLKNHKNGIYERCRNILCTKKLFDHHNDYLELTKPQTFAALLHFYSQKNLHFNIENFPNDAKKTEKYFTKANIPMIINNTILNISCGNLIADAILYQYQMIFDAIDSGPKSLVVLEIFLSVIHKLMKIKVPKYSGYTNRNKYDQYLKKIDSTNISLTEKIETQNDKKPTISLNTFKNRFKKSNKKEKHEQSNSNHMSSFEFFWNSLESNFGYFKGIIFNKSTDKIKNQKNWTKEIKNLLKSKTKHEAKKASDQQYISFKDSKGSFVSKLYKLFCYDETNKSWTFQNENFERFAKDKRIDIDESKTPIVFLLNSLEEDSISLITNLIGGLYPKIDSEQDIFIYSFCDRPLSMLNYHVDFLNREKSSIKPIFLLLHVPKSKEKLPNLELIIFEIYTILMLISDLKVIILNENYYNNQIETIKIFNDIYKSIKLDFDQQFDDNSFYSGTDNSNNKSDDDNDDYEIEEEEKWENKYENEKKINENGSLINIHFKSPKTIFLINNSSVKSSNSIENNLKENQFFTSFIKNIDAEIHPINIKDPDSYETFLQTLNDYLISLNTKFSEIRNNFDSILDLKASFSYSKIRLNQANWKEKLKEIILKRKIELETNAKNDDFLNLISDLNYELHIITPKFDTQFINECNSILSDIKTNHLKKNREFYSSELQISAESHLKYLDERINQKYFWDEEQIDLVKNSHLIFLKQEFFDIIKLSNPEKNFRFAYEANFDVLNDQIHENKLKLDKIFKPFIDLIKMKKNRKEQNLKEEVRKGVNYSMNETENIKEVRIIVQAGKDLTSEIEQDF